MITVLFFGRLSVCGDAMKIDMPEGVSDTRALADWISVSNPVFAESFVKPGNRVALNQEILCESAPIKDGDEIAFMSPLSGG